MNMVILSGHIGRDPEQRSTTSGLAVTTFSVATNRRVKGESVTEWHNIVTFDKLAEICSEYLAKGAFVSIVGRIQTREWTDKDGNRRWTTEIIASDVEFGPKKEQHERREPPREQRQERRDIQPGRGEDEIPF